MQIYELTMQPNPVISEGLFDTLKAAADWEPGQSFAQAKAKVKNDAGVASVAKKAQAVWQSYEQQLQKSIAQQPATPVKPVATAKPAAVTPQPSSGVSVKTTAGNVVKGADGKWKSSTGEITNPADIQELERRAKQQATLAAQNKQMSPASGIREAAAATTSPGGIAIPAGAKTATPIAPVTTPAPTQSTNPLNAYKNRTDGRYEQALKAFVQKNLLAGMPYSRLQNAREIDQLINTMSQPQYADPKAQAPLWQQLALAAAVAATVPQSAGGARPEPTVDKSDDISSTSTQSARELIDPVQQVMQKNQFDLSKAGRVMINFNNNETAIRSTGNPGVDAMLLAMGFTI